MNYSKVCTKCKVLKPEEKFSYSNKAKNKLHSWCRECMNSHNRERYKTDPVYKQAWKKNRNPESHRETNRKHQFKKTLKMRGISPEQYEEVFNKQSGKCAICLQPEKLGTKLCIDHCHVTNTVRGLLCRTCNVALGLLHLDDPENHERVHRIIEYLQNSYSNN